MFALILLALNIEPTFTEIGGVLVNILVLKCHTELRVKVEYGALEHSTANEIMRLVQIDVAVSSWSSNALYSHSWSLRRVDCKCPLLISGV